MTNPLDQFYTKGSVAQQCLKMLESTGLVPDDALWIEPSAGAGAFYRLLPQDRRVGVDLDPQHPEVVHGDFLEWESPFPYDRCVVIGNPPFGKRGDLAAKFVNRSLRHAGLVGMILPRNFDRYDGQNRIDAAAELIVSEQLPADSFELADGTSYSVGTVFQVWISPDLLAGGGGRSLRQRKRAPSEHHDFELRQYNNTKQALHCFDGDFDFAVPCQGYQDYSRRETSADGCERNKQWMLIKAGSAEALSVLRSIDYEALAHSSQTAQAGFRKWALVDEYSSVRPPRLPALIDEIRRNPRRFLAGRTGGDFEKELGRCLETDCSFTRLSVQEFHNKAGAEWGPLKEAVQDLSCPSENVAFLGQLDACFVEQPYGSQQYPDFLVWDNRRTVAIEAKCLDKGGTRPVWNGGLPREDGIYIIGSRGKTMDVTMFRGGDVLEGPDRAAMAFFIDTLRPLEEYVNSRVAGRQPYGFHVYLRKAFGQAKKHNPDSCLDWFANPDRDKLEKSVSDWVR